MATLKALADRTGYAPATISRILSDDPSLSVTPEARRTVLEEAGNEIELKDDDEDTYQPDRIRDDDDFYGYNAGGESDFAAAGFTLKEGSDEDDLVVDDAGDEDEDLMDDADDGDLD